jgi:hypothetical protein
MNREEKTTVETRMCGLGSYCSGQKGGCCEHDNEAGETAKFEIRVLLE